MVCVFLCGGLLRGGETVCKKSEVPNPPFFVTESDSTKVKATVKYGKFDPEAPEKNTGFAWARIIYREYVRRPDEPQKEASATVRVKSQYAKMSDEKGKTKSDAYYVPRGSIVTLTDPKLAGKIGKGEKPAFVPVKVESVGGAKGEEQQLDQFADGIVADPSRKVKPEQRGYVWSGSLKPAGKYGFVVTKASPFLGRQFPGGVVKEGSVLRFAQTQAGKYKVTECCSTDSGKCEIDYILDVTDPLTGEVMGSALHLGGTDWCESRDSMLPVRADLIEPMRRIANAAGISLGEVRVLSSFGRVQIPVTEDPDTGVMGPYGSVHYNPNKPLNSDIYGDPTSVCAFMSVLKSWEQEECPVKSNPLYSGCRVQFGDMAHPIPAEMNGRDLNGHQTHESGQCIDLRPMRKFGLGPVKSSKEKMYDRERTLKLIKHLKAAGGAITYGDKAISDEDDSIQYLKSHSDHIHVCFSPESKKVKKACERMK